MNRVSNGEGGTMPRPIVFHARYPQSFASSIRRSTSPTSKSSNEIVAGAAVSVPGLSMSSKSSSLRTWFA
jgi:hypothetical protein